MKVIILKTIDKLGTIGDIKDVTVGYFRNFLLPRGLAKKATPAGIQEAEHMRTRVVQQHAHDKLEFNKILEKLKDDQFVIYRKATEEGHLFGSVNEKDVVAILSEKGYVVDEEHIHLDQPVKALGTYTVSLRYGEDSTGTISLTVERGT